jgi:arsenate reductase
MKNILFVCQANSVRSQMAEGWARALGGKKVEVRSAGLAPGSVSDTAIAVMRNADIDISNQSSRQMTRADLEWADFVVTMADSVQPFVKPLPPHTIHIHWSIPNPDGLPEARVDIDSAYETVSDMIRDHVMELISTLPKRKSQVDSFPDK